MTTLTNTNNTSIKGGAVMNRLIKLLINLKDDGYDYVTIGGYTPMEWKEFNTYNFKNKLGVVTLNKEFTRGNVFYLSDRAIKQHRDIERDRPHETFEAKSLKLEKGEWLTDDWTPDIDMGHEIETQVIKTIKTRDNMVRGCGTIIHTINKSYIK